MKVVQIPFSEDSELKDEINISNVEENYRKLNEIKMILKIEECCQNNLQYFLDADNLNDSLKVLNDSNTELYINDKKLNSKIIIIFLIKENMKLN